MSDKNVSDRLQSYESVTVGEDYNGQSINNGPSTAASGTTTGTAINPNLFGNGFVGGVQHEHGGGVNPLFSNYIGDVNTAGNAHPSNQVGVIGGGSIAAVAAAAAAANAGGNTGNTGGAAGTSGGASTGATESTDVAVGTPYEVDDGTSDHKKSSNYD